VYGALPGIEVSAGGKIRIPFDTFDFDQKDPRTDPRGFVPTILRNILTFGGRIAQGPRFTGFEIHFRQDVQLPSDLHRRFEALRSGQ
jgi:hypothetical protein